MSFPHRRLALTLPLAAVIALGACRDREPEQPEFENDTNVIEEQVMPENLTAAPEAAPENVQAEVKHAPPPVIPDEQQILDDAAAVGMTARIPRAEDIVPTEDKPAERKSAVADKTADKDDQALNQIY
ncbi:MAG: hypothetical protein E2598_10230 [Sphingobium sp.]|nr:hypothetical protein [Sphingobium sp.]